MGVRIDGDDNDLLSLGGITGPAGSTDQTVPVQTHGGERQAAANGPSFLEKTAGAAVMGFTGGGLQKTTLGLARKGSRLAAEHPQIASAVLGPFGPSAIALGQTIQDEDSVPIFEEGERTRDAVANLFGHSSAAEFEMLLDESPTAKVMQVAGEWAPQMIAGAGAWSFGRKAAVAAGSKLMQVMGVSAGQTMMRTIEIAGGSIASGAFSGVQAAASGEEKAEIMSQAAWGALFTAGWEGAAFGAGRYFMAKQLRGQELVADKIKAALSNANRYEKGLNKVAGKQTWAVARSLGLDHNVQEARAWFGPAGGAAARGQAIRKAVEAVKAGDDAAVVGGKAYLEAAAKLRSTWQSKDFLGTLRETLKQPSVLQLLNGGTPPNPRLVQEAAYNISRVYFSAPAAVYREMGPTMAAFGQMFATVEGSYAPMHRGISRALTDLGDDAWRELKHHPELKALGKKNGAFFRPIIELYETAPAGRGIAAVEAKYGKKAADVLTWYSNTQNAFMAKLEGMGNPIRRLSPEELSKMGVNNYFFHMVNPSSKLSMDELQRLMADKIIKQTLGKREAIIDAAKKAGQKVPKNLPHISQEEAQRIASAVLKQPMMGLPKAAGADHLRAQAGTWLSKVTDHPEIYEQNPFVAMESSLAGLTKKTLYAEAFGMDADKARDFLRFAAVNEGANAPVVDAMLGVAFGQHSYPVGMRRFAKTVTSIETALKMPFAFISNMSGPMNAVTAHGIQNSGRALQMALKGESRKDVAKYLAMTSHGYDRFISSMADDVPMAENLADQAAKSSMMFFTPVESWNQYFSKLATLASVRDTFAKHAAGRLRGNALGIAQRRMARLGIDLDDIAKRGYEQGLKPGEQIGGLWRPSQLEVMMERGKDFSQSLPTKLTRPVGWDHPFARIVTQFKSFAFNQGRLIRDAVLKEAYHGNLEPLVLVTAAYPIVGEAVGSAKAFARGIDHRPEDPLDRYIYNVAMVGGIGLSGDAMASILYGRAFEFFLGPAVVDTAKVFEGGLNMATGNPEPAITWFNKQPSTRAALRTAELVYLPTAWGYEQMREYIDLDDEIADSYNESSRVESEVPQSLEDIRTRLGQKPPSIFQR